MKNYQETALKAVETASNICQNIQRSLIGEDILLKNDRSPVTIADYVSQAVVCRILKSVFPDIPVVGEENAVELLKEENRNLLEKINSFLPDWTREEILDNINQGCAESDGFFWTLDPIDGTKGFMRRDQYAVALALIKNGRVILGVLGCPSFPNNGFASGLIFSAQKDQGAWERTLNSEKSIRLRISMKNGHEEIHFLEGVESGHSDHVKHRKIADNIGRPAKISRYDSQVKYAMLSKSMADVYLRLPNPRTPGHREKIWDHAAGALIVTEAGGKVTDINGALLDFNTGKELKKNNGIVVTNGFIHDKILNLIKD
jgi:3'(2'), 5'-bisphosphate nucleotidase